MSKTYEDTGLTMMITAQDHIAAQTFCQQHQDKQKAKQVYLNTLAIRAVDRYLQYFGISTDIEQSASTDPITRHLLDTGALHIVDVGNIECRPVLADATRVYIPAEVHNDRLGYVIVRLDDQLEMAALLGFIPKAMEEYIPLSTLQPIEALLDAASPPIKVFTHLSQWLQSSFEAGWQIVDEIFNSSHPAMAFRNPSEVLRSKLDKTEDIVRGRVFMLNPSAEETPLLLAVGINPSAAEEISIWVRVIPAGNHKHLPYDLELKLLDEEGTSLMQAQSRETESIGLQFKGALGDRFNVQISSEGASHTEFFVI